MPERLNDKEWRLKNSWWLLLTLLPYLDCLAFFYIGYQVKRRSYTLVGAAFAAAWVGTQVYGLFGHTTGFGADLLIWPTAIVLALAWRGSYLKLLASRRQREPVPHPLALDGQWRIKNSMWLLWSLIPGLGGFSLLHIGSRAKNRGWKLWGILYLVIGAPLALLAIEQIVDITDIWRTIEAVLEQRLGTARAWEIVFGTRMLAFLLPPIQVAVQMFHSLLLRGAYLESIAPEYEASRLRYPCLTSHKWKVSSSWWMLICLVPYCGGAGIIFAGLRTKKKGWIIQGAVITTVFIALSTLGNSFPTGAIHSAYGILIAFTYITAFACTLMKYEPYLAARAVQLDGYDSAIDRELAAQETFRRRVGGEKPAAADKTASAPLEPQKRHERTPNQTGSLSMPPEGPAGKSLDINACSEEDFRALPGMTLAQAKKAASYRAEHGGFVSVEAFVDILEIKPHFAVQIFKSATASPIVKTAVDPDARPVKRRIDI